MKNRVKLLLLGFFLCQTTNANDIDFYRCMGNNIDLKFVRADNQNILKIKINGQHIEADTIKISNFENSFMVSAGSAEPYSMSLFLDKPLTGSVTNNRIEHYHAFQSFLFLPTTSDYQLHRLRCNIFGLTDEQLDEILSAITLAP